MNPSSRVDRLKHRVQRDFPETWQLEGSLADGGILEAVVGESVVEGVRPEGVRRRRVGGRCRRCRRVVLRRGMLVSTCIEGTQEGGVRTVKPAFLSCVKVSPV